MWYLCSRPSLFSTLFPMQSPPTTLPPLPLRARGVLEMLDSSVKVYRQYFWVLLGWSALVMVPGQLFYIVFFLLPLLVGACVCSLTTAVRGQPLTWNQCGQFARPRYGAMLGVQFVGFLALGLIFIALAIAFFWLGSGFFSAFDSLPWFASLLLGIGLFLAYLFFVSTALLWINMAVIVTCMEEDKRNPKALGRAFSLLQGHWIKVSALVSLLGLGMLALLGILWGLGIAVVGVSSLRGFFEGTGDEASGIFALIALLTSTVFVWVLWSPIFYLTLGLFYLDLRVRKEALDIEWNAHQTMPPQEQPHQQVAPAPTFAPHSAPQETPQAFETAPDSLQPVNTNPAQTLAPISAQTVRLPDPQSTPSVAATPGPEIAAPAAVAPAAVAPADATITCSQCGHASSAQQSFCMNCGARLHQTR